jgi:hypothetical protein
MNKVIYLILGFLIAFAILFIISCDDFFSPTIEIFNETSTPTDVKQEQKKEKRDHSVRQN